MANTTRQASNQKLVDIIQTLVKQYPDLRFSQILQSFDFVVYNDLQYNGGPVWENEFYVEPDVILERVKKALGRA